jgi:hypothetical protein
MDFVRCHAFVSIVITPDRADKPLDPEALKAYGRRLDQRLAEKVCS